MKVSSVCPDSPVNVTDFDFRQTDQLPAADLLQFRRVQEAFAQQLGEELSGYFRKEFSISVREVSQVTWSAYSERFSDPACLLLLKGQAQPGYGTLELGPSFVFSVLEILLGGTAESASGTSRELTAIERKLLAGFFRSVQLRLREAWSDEGPDFLLESVIGSPGAATGISRQEALVVVEFDVRTDPVEGHMSLAVPARFVRQRRQDSGTGSASMPNLRQAGDAARIMKRIQSGVVHAETVLTKATIRMGDLAALEPGDVLNLGCPVSAPLSMRVNGTEVYTGFIVPAGDKRAFAIHAVNPGAVSKL